MRRNHVCVLGAARGAVGVASNSQHFSVHAQPARDNTSQELLCESFDWIQIKSRHALGCVSSEEHCIPRTHEDAGRSQVPAAYPESSVSSLRKHKAWTPEEWPRKTVTGNGAGAALRDMAI